ncbi:hypothetical protein R4Z09_20510 [Niallia oryzisoli]|uniref:NADH dehydrogenase subunit 4L n=1 Tax=Niallia oryzisoli TaxID=1737571 RepID=A0ABZ2C7T3_9BACI
MNGMKHDTLLFFSYLIITIAMGTFTFVTFLDIKILFSLIFAEISLGMFAVVLLKFMYNRKLVAERIK